MMKHRKHRATGGVNEAKEDLDSKPERRVNAKVNDEAEERKHGGHVSRHHRKRGGHVKHEGMGPEHEPTMMRHHRKRGGKIVGEVHGEMAKHHAGRKPRKSGGSADAMPFSSARKGEAPKGRNVDMEME